MHGIISVMPSKQQTNKPTTQTLFVCVSGCVCVCVIYCKCEHETPCDPVWNKCSRT